MKKIFNYRPMVFAAIAMIVGIFISTFFVCGKIDRFSFLMISILFCLLLLVSLFLMIFTRKHFDFKRFFKRVFVFFCVVLVGVSSVFVCTSGVNSHKFEAGKYDVRARIVSILSHESDFENYSLILDNLEVEKDSQTFSIHGKAKIYVYGEVTESKLRVGDFVKFEAHLYAISMESLAEIKSGFSSLTDGIFTKGTIYESIETTGESRVSIFEEIKIVLAENLSSSMSSENAGVAYGMLFGDKSMMNDSVMENYRNSGMAHLLAVSGLHVGFVVTLLTFLFSLLKVKDKVSFVVITLSLILYLVICGFSPSMVRAFIMTECLLFAKCRGRLYDSLSAICFALIIILIISPLSLFDVGLRLSFGAVFAIIFLMKRFERLFAKFLYKPFASALALSLSASIGVSVVSVTIFGKISLLSVFVNMVVIPIASIAFMVLFVLGIMSIIIPNISGVLVIFEYLMVPVNGMAIASAGIAVNNLQIMAKSGFECMIFGGMVAVSEFSFGSKIKKALYACACFALGILIMFL